MMVRAPMLNLGIWMNCWQQTAIKDLNSHHLNIYIAYSRDSSYVPGIYSTIVYSCALTFAILRRCSLHKFVQDGCASCSRVSTAVSIEKPHYFSLSTDIYVIRLTEEVLYESTDARTEVLAALRELGPPDLVHLIKKAPRNPGKEVSRTSNL